MPVLSIRLELTPEKAERLAARAAADGLSIDDFVGGLIERARVQHEIDEAVIAKLLSAIVETFDPLQVWLFGSRAEGYARPDSDYDLLVVVADDVDDAMLDPGRGYDIARRLLIAADIVPCTREVFEGEANVFDTLPHAAVHRGRKVYDRPQV